MFAASKTAAVSSAANYIEDVFSTYLYTGTGSAQTITNGIDLSTKGGLVWTKSRSNSANSNLVDTARGADSYLISNSTVYANSFTGGGDTAFSFGTTGYTTSNFGNVAQSALTFASWTFRKQPKFFDVVTYTGNGNNNRLINHNLKSTPGCVIVKCTSDADEWAVWHRSLTSTQYSMALNTTAAQGNAQVNQSFSFDGSVSMSSTQFVVSQESGNANSSDKTYVAYLFAHNAGGFGLTGTDNVISCGSYTGNGSSTTIDLGYEPQWLLIKSSSSSSYNWVILDNMRGLSGGSNGTPRLYPNSSGAEAAGNELGSLNATGFTVSGGNSNVNGVTYIYIAIRRGPMKVPTSGTSVFSPIAATNASGTANTTNFPIDLQILSSPSGDGRYVVDRLRGVSTNSTAVATSLRTEDTAAENGTNLRSLFWNNTSFQTTAYYNNYSAIYWNFKRAPSFFDEVCYTGTNPTPQNINHNLGVAPELMIVKVRSVSGDDWVVYCSKVTDANIVNLRLNTTQAIDYNGDMWDATTPTSTTFRVGQSVLSNYGSQKLVAYLFATCAGVSKVGSYTGTGTTKQIDCGFTGGARFVLIKRTDSTGDWYVWDTARGIVSGNDPYLFWNTQGAQVTNTDYVDTYSAGFEISSTAPAAINASGGTFIFLAIA